MFRPVEGIEDKENEGEKDLKKNNLTRNDVVLGISASGRTPYVLGALKYARKLYSKTIVLTANRNSVLQRFAHITICPDTGAEVITGSTRMKAGTAQKLVLNMISTCAMIKLGKVYGNLMVGVRPVSKKLLERQRKIIMLATGLSYGEAKRKLVESKMDVKLAIVMGKSGLKYADAKKLLKESKGSLDGAIHLATIPGKT
jgi:N-acetylmuramic acid 6-phosphate etherase